MDEPTTVLLVESDPDLRVRLGGWLEGSGMQVIVCPGPLGHTTCVGVRSGRCPLAEAADVVVLDLTLDGDALMEGVSGMELLALYRSLRTPVVTLARDRASLARESDGDVVGLLWPTDRDALVGAVRSVDPSSSDARRSPVPRSGPAGTGAFPIGEAPVSSSIPSTNRAGPGGGRKVPPDPGRSAHGGRSPVPDT